ncbi:hypothetical protein MMC17_006912 [Xylographa soralifera]|nr:hypothetical protein [Xylographa soralifera]
MPKYKRLLRCLPHARLHERPESTQQRKKSSAECGRLLPTYVRHAPGVYRASSPDGRAADRHLAAEIGHEKAQSVIDSITSSYAAEGQAGANPMLGQHPGPGQPFPPPPFGFPGGLMPPFGMPAGGPGGFPPPMPGNGMPFPPFPPNAAGGMPPLPGGMPFPAGMPPPDFRFPPPQFGPPQGMGPSPGGQGGFGPPPFGGGGDRR